MKIDTFADSILKCCDNRSNDCVTTIKGRIEYFCGDLHAADCIYTLTLTLTLTLIYHHSCSINLQTDHTEPLLKIMSQPKLSDLYIINLLKLYYKLYRNRLPTYFECFLPEYGGHQHNLRNDLIRLPIIHCEFEEMNAKFQMHRTLYELASPRNSAQYTTIQINDDTLGTSYKAFLMYLKSQFVNFYRVACNHDNCYVCENSN